MNRIAIPAVLSVRGRLELVMLVTHVISVNSSSIGANGTRYRVAVCKKKRYDATVYRPTLLDEIRGSKIEAVQFPKSYAVGVAVAVALLAIALLIGLYFYMQYS